VSIFCAIHRAVLQAVEIERIFVCVLATRVRLAKKV